LSCGQKVQRKRCRGCGEIEHFSGQQTFHCDDRFCAVCASRRAGKLSAQWGRGLAWYEKQTGATPSFVTLTLKDSDRLPPFKNLTKYLQKLRKHPFWREWGLLGGFASIEVKVGKGSRLWHPHIHMVVYTERKISLIEVGEHVGRWQNRINQELSDAWDECTGGRGYIVQGQKFEGVNEAIKYIVKGMDHLDDTRLFEVAEWARNRKFLVPFGSLLRNKEMRAVMEAEEEESTSCECPKCGGTDFDIETFTWSEALGCYVLDRVDEWRAPPPKRE